MLARDNLVHLRLVRRAQFSQTQKAKK